MVKYFLGALCIALVFVSCKKETETFNTASLSDYYPLQVGKYITYNLDSSLFVNFGQKDTVIHYQAQDRIDALITDNLGRPSYRVFRYLRNDESLPWVFDNTFMVTPTGNSIEYDENNLRFIKLVLPIRQDYSWKGNIYLTSNPYPSYQFGSAFTDGWDYMYDSVGAPLTINSIPLDSTIKVFEIDETTNDPATVGDGLATRTYGVEKYAKGIGLIYKEYLHWEYQGNDQTYKGFGVTMSIIDHN